MENKEAASSKNKKIKIISLVIGIIIVILAAVGIYLNVTKPSSSELLSSSAKTTINSGNSVIEIKSKKENVTQTMNFNDKVTHMSLLSNPANSQDQNYWANEQRVYTKLKNKWYYLDISNNQVYKMFFNTMFTSSKKLFTRHNFAKFNSNALSKLDVKLDGLSGYSISYSGNDSDVIKGILQSSQVTNAQATPLANQIKKVTLNIKTDRNKNLRDLQYTLTYKQNLGSISFHLSDINGVKDLSVPKSVTSKAKETSLENLQK